MGSYLCEANNGIPPSATRVFNVDVHCEMAEVSNNDNIYLLPVC